MTLNSAAAFSRARAPSHRKRQYIVFPHARALAAVLPLAAIGLWAGSATAAPVGAIQLTNFTNGTSPTVMPVVTQVGSVRRKALSGGRTQVIVNLRYNATGRYSLLLEGPTGKRIPLLRGSRMGRMPAMFLCPSIVRGGVAGTGVTFKGIIRGRVPEGAVLRAIRRGADGALTGADVHIS